MPEAGGLPAESVVTSYDDLLRPTALTGTTSYVTATAYSTVGQLLQAELSTGETAKKAWLTSEYERGTGRLTKARLDRQGVSTVDMDAAYRYDPAGNVRSIADTPAGGPRDIQCFDYDHLRRLTQAWSTATSNADPCAGGPATTGVSGPAAYHQSWTFDAVGNRRTETLHGLAGAANTTRTYTYPPQGLGQNQPHVVQEVSESGPAGARSYGYGYDKAGNTTCRPNAVASNACTPGSSTNHQALAWDAEGRLASSTPAGGQTTSNVYDASGLRLVRKEPAATTLYLPGTELRLDLNSRQVTATRSYSFAGKTVAVRSARGVHFQSADHHGTSNASIDAATGALALRRTTPYGGPRGADPVNWPDQAGFVGSTEDGTSGLAHMGARQYDAKLGRFISIDPIMDIADPQQIHGSAYSNNNPVTWSDPSGLLGSASCAPGYVGGPGACTGGENGTAPAGQFGYSARETVLPNGTVASQVGDRSYVNGVDITEGLQRPGAPTFDAFVTGFDNFVGDHPPGEGLDIYDPDVTSTAIYLATKDGYIKYDKSKGSHFWFWTHTQHEELGAALMQGGMSPAFGSLPIGGRPGGGLRPGVGPGGGYRLTGMPSCIGNSFAADTLVLMADGSYERIDEVDAGDRVVATDPETGRTGPREVTATIDGDGPKHLVMITVDTDGARGERTGTVIATAGHPLWVDSKGRWVDAGKLLSGDHLRTSEGRRLRVVGTRQWTGERQVHNLSIDGIHTYYVRTTGDGVDADILAHNVSPCPRSIGHYPDYVNLGDSSGAKYFSIPKGVWARMTPAQQRAANERFLDRGIAEGATFYLATPIDRMRTKSDYAWEINYLFDHGYTFNRAGDALIPAK